MGNPSNGLVGSCRAAARAPRTLASIDGPATAQKENSMKIIGKASKYQSKISIPMTVFFLQGFKVLG